MISSLVSIPSNAAAFWSTPKAWLNSVSTSAIRCFCSFGL